MSRINSNVRINEFPRSGGTWLSKMLADLFNLPFPQKAFLPLVKCIEHAHYIESCKGKKIYVIRDGRDVMTSAFFHFLTYREGKSRALVDQWRMKVNYTEHSDPEKFMPLFIREFSKFYSAGGRRVSWSEHVCSFDRNDPMVLVVRYENMLESCSQVLTDVCSFLELKPKRKVDEVVSNNSFEILSKRQKGVEVKNSFYRKGVAGDWKNYFSPTAVETFMALHGDALRFWDYD